MKWLDEFARQNTFLSILILAVVGNLVYDIIKKLAVIFWTKFSLQASRNAQKTLQFLLKHYTEEIERVERIKSKDPGEILELLEILYSNVRIFFVTLVLYLIALRLNDGRWFYSFLFVTSGMMFKIVANSVYQYGLIRKAKKFEMYKQETMNKILKLSNRISK